jgi:3D-(3,5/4)-trihydroxycyclohexane-1,2-dione acylhydrolase (decyclizing)
VDFAANAHSLGAHTLTIRDVHSLRLALADAKAQARTTVIVVEADREQRVGGYESWWDVPIAEVAELPSVQTAYTAYREARQRERHHL